MQDRLYYRKHNQNLAVLVRTPFTTLWRSEIRINLKIDPGALNRR